MSAIIKATIDEINAEHLAATQHAEQAVDHAKRAGELLLTVKSELRHGEFLPWIDENLVVSRRQAQRYMRAAQGKRITARALKNDTVSLLGWLPSDSHLAVSEVEADTWLEVQQIPHAKGYYQYLFIHGSTVMFTKRGLSSNYITDSIMDVVPPYLAKQGPHSLVWQYLDVPADELAEKIKRLEAMPFV